ncbi:BEL1-like homeodomain protein 6 [Forsythia ovata]|uniref:BEL1-like homeodomain protein 6 n=1 Tax=Forsythia ovata TaxID=205694 RepID=A0ABD1Q153_9LAMI
MGTYYPSSNNQRDAATILYSRDSLNNSYSETQLLPGHMSMYMNFSSSSESYQNPNREFSSNLDDSRIVQHDFDAWKDEGRNQTILMNSVDGSSGVVPGDQQNFQGQGLSLSLSTNVQSGMQISSFQYQNPNPNFLNPNEGMIIPGSNSDGKSRPVLDPKYLKAVQELLDEIVHVEKGVNKQNSKKELMRNSRESDGESGNGNSENSQSEVSAAEKQDLQNKIGKLLSMLDEVDRRYRQYYHQMQIVVSSFDIIVGSGAAKPYTSLAFHTISRHFRCLRDAINGQIQAAQKSLGEQDSSANGKGIGLSRLRYVDQKLRQQRALQQLGVMQHGWRPQRGLPESSVSILRAWLFEHFLHPYPKDSDKIMLARQTGLTRSQVSNWFINARVRLWKPMVEEMYKEEIGDAEMDSNSSHENASKATKSDAREDLQQNATSPGTECCSPGNVPDLEMVESETNQIFQNTARVEPENDYGIERTTRDRRTNMDDPSLSPDTLLHSNCGTDRFIEAEAAAYHMSEMERLGSGNEVSLTLGLQHFDGSSLPMSDGTQHSFFTIRGNAVYNEASSTGTHMGSGNGQNRFASSSLLHDFVA